MDAFPYRDGAVGDRRVVVPGLPDAKSPELRGAYAHALKSVTVGPDGALYVSVGSTGNISAADRDATPQRASILRVPPGGGAPEVYARGVRNGTGLAVAPDGAVWTAVNNRDNIAYPDDEDYDGDGAGDRDEVLTGYVNDHPLEPLARLTPGRDLGWPYCNPDPDVDRGAPGSALSYTDRPFLPDVQTNPDGAALDCAALPAVEQGMGAHSAPLGLSFATAPGLAAPWGPGALVGVHGSWNRRPPRRARGVVLPLARRDARCAADPARRVPGGRRLAVGAAGDGAAGPGRRGLRDRRPGRRGVPDGAVLTFAGEGDAAAERWRPLSISRVRGRA